MNFIKMDDSLMQGLSTNQLQQQRVKGLVEAAKRKGVETVAERVEDANTMAVLWQLGIEFIQGYFVNAPEDVTMSGERSADPGRRRPTPPRPAIPLAGRPACRLSRSAAGAGPSCPGTGAAPSYLSFIGALLPL